MKNKMDYLLGSYGPWLSSIIPDGPRPLSFLHPRWSDIEAWRRTARDEVRERVSKADIGKALPVRKKREYEFDGLRIEELSWALPYGPETHAVFLKPTGSNERLPGILGLHNHGGNKYFGKSKIIRTSERIHPLLMEHQRNYYGGVAWANEIAKRGFAVLVHDVFPFGSRKITASELPPHVVQRMMDPPELIDEVASEELSQRGGVTKYDVPEDEPNERIDLYNAFARQHEDIIAKSLFSAGLTWPGLFLAEDEQALSYLCSREDVDPERIGCCGLSGGGLRTDYLAGLDDRIRCSVTAGFMTSWRDLALYVCYTHTWMVYIPLLARQMDFPEILGLRVPLPAMVLATEEDPLFSLEEVKKAIGMLEKIYMKAGASEAFQANLYKGPHKFDRPMQADAFNWFERWLKVR
jgi:dienelactone hydrolase